MTHALKRPVPLALLFAAPLLVGASPAPDPSPSVVVPASAPAPETLTPPVLVTPFIQPFDLDATRRMSVKVMIGDKGPYSFLVDTGAERTVIARELAERLVERTGRLDGSLVAGADVLQGLLADLAQDIRGGLHVLKLLPPWR